MLHEDTWQTIAEGAANTATHGDIESACDVLEFAAGACERRIKVLDDYGPLATRAPELEEERIALQSTARELRAFVDALRTADEEVG